MLLYLLFALWPKKRASLAALAVLLAGLGFNTATIIERWIEAGHPPFTNMYESMVFFAWCIATAYVIFEFVTKIQKIGWLVVLFAVLTTAFASFYTSSEIRPLVPSLDSNWLTVHVISYFAAYAVLTVSFVSSIIFLVTHFREPYPARGETLKCFHLLTRRAIRFAFPLLTTGLITGSVWANEVGWGYWSWDPKETWSLVTWLIYLNFLHLRYTLPGVLKSLGWKQEKTPFIENIFAFCGFLVNGFTYIGVNYLLSGQHAYT